MCNSQAKQALILFAHGSRNAQWHVPFEQIAECFWQYLRANSSENASNIVVNLAFLEFSKPSLNEVVENLVKQDFVNITIVPLFLGMGLHVHNDLKALCDKLLNDYPSIKLRVTEAIGLQSGVQQAIVQFCMQQILRQ